MIAFSTTLKFGSMPHGAETREGALIVWGALQSKAEFLTAKIAAGALVEIIGSVVLKLHKSAHTQLDKLRRDRDAMHLVLQMHDKEARDRVSTI